MINHEDEFVNFFRILHRNLANNNTATYFPVSQKVNTFLCYHKYLVHTQAHNFYEFLKVTAGSQPYANIKELLQKCEICEKFTSVPEPPKSIIPITVKEPFSTWSIDVVGPMPTAKNDVHAKNYIVTSLYSVTQWIVAKR